MSPNILVRLFGFRAAFIGGDPTVLDRWLWLRRKLPRTANHETLVDIGCGTGGFAIGAARRGYRALGLTWSATDQAVAAERANLCGIGHARFDVQDVRYLETRGDLRGSFDIAVCCENIEHILDDRKLLKNIGELLKPGGHLLLTAPFYFGNEPSALGLGPYPEVENGAHVRRGYSPAMLHELCEQADLRCEDISFCTGIVSQSLTRLMRVMAVSIHWIFAWIVVLPLRVLPPLLDPLLTPLLRKPCLSICMTAYKPRFASRLATCPPSA